MSSLSCSQSLHRLAILPRSACRWAMSWLVMKSGKNFDQISCSSCVVLGICAHGDRFFGGRSHHIIEIVHTTVAELCEFAHITVACVANNR